MPDFTKFEKSNIVFYNAVLVGINYYVPGSIVRGVRKEHYRLFVSNDTEDMPGILGLCRFLFDKEPRYWLYNANEEPYEVSNPEIDDFLNAWIRNKYEEKTDKKPNSI